MPRHRYPGINSFTESDEAIFCGRSEDAKKLLARLMLGKTLVLHGESGKGKTSLVQAGLLPELKRYNSLLKSNGKLPYLPVIIKMNEVAKNDTGTAILQHVLHTIWDFQVRADMDNDAVVPFLTEHKDSLWYQATLAERNGYSLVLIFDQFEELQNFSRTEISEFTLQLSELFMGIMPDRFYKEYDEGTKRIHAEERTNTYNEDIKFIEQPLSTRLMFVVREDRLGTMSLMNDHFPDILKNDYFLLPLTERSARLAISEPCKTEGDFESKPFVIEPDAVDELIARLSKKEDPGFFDPIELQIVCSIIERKISVGKKSITAAQLPEQRDILNSYYHGIWTEVRAKLKMEQWEFEDRQKLLLDKLVVDGRRNLVIGKQLIDEGNKQDQLMVKELLEMGFLRMVFPIDQQTKFYQLTHDRLIQPLTDHQSTLRAREEVKGDIEENKRRLARLKKIWSWIGGILLGLTIIVILIAYARVRKEKKIAEQEKYLLISSSLRRAGNPTLGYVIAKDWMNKNKNSETMKRYLAEFDSSNYVYLSGIFPSRDQPVSATILDEQRFLIRESNRLVTWDMQRGIIIKSDTTDKEQDSYYKELDTPDGKRISAFLKGDYFILEDENGNELFSSDDQHLTIFPSFETVAVSTDARLLFIDYMVVDTKKPDEDTFFLPQYKTYRESDTIGEESLPYSSLFLSINRLAVGYYNGDIVIYDISLDGSGIKAVDTLPISSSVNTSIERPVTAMVYDNRKKYLYAANSRNGIDLWDLNIDANSERRGLVKTEWAHTGKINCLRLSPDKNILLSGSADNTAILWSTKALTKAAIIKNPTNTGVMDAWFLNDGKAIVTLTDDNNFCVWRRERPAILYDKKQLYRFSAFNYSMLLLDEREDGVSEDTSSTASFFATTLREVLNIPLNSEFPDDKSYGDSLNSAKKRVTFMYDRLMLRKDYPAAVSEINRSLLDARYFRILSDVDQEIVRAKNMLRNTRKELVDSTKSNGRFIFFLQDVNDEYLEINPDYDAALKFLTFCTDSIVMPLLKDFGPRREVLLIERSIADAWFCYYLYTSQYKQAREKARELSTMATTSYKMDVYLVAIDLVTGKYAQASSLYQTIMADSTRRSVTDNTEKVTRRLLKNFKKHNIEPAVVDSFATRFNIDLD